MAEASIQNKKSAGEIGKSTLVAIGVAAVVNAVLFLVGSTFTFPPDALTPMGAPVGLGPVVIFSIVPLLGAAVVYAILNRYTGNPNRIFYILAGVMFVFMFFSPFGIENVPTAEIVILELMHVVAAGSIVYFLTKKS